MSNLQLAHKHISKDKNIQGGRAVISGTRIPASDIVYWYKQGKDVSEIVDMFPHVSLAQVHDALAYYYDNSKEIDEEIKEYQKE
jgi:uncharacterized protein (DUF433 family)